MTVNCTFPQACNAVDTTIDIQSEMYLDSVIDEMTEPYWMTTVRAVQKLCSESANYSHVFQISSCFWTLFIGHMTQLMHVDHKAV